MAFNPTEQQKEKLRKGSSELTFGGKTVRVWGTVGTLEHFGFPVDDATADLASAGISKAVQREGGKRSRWLGDTTGTAFEGGTAVSFLYPSKRGTALAGVPVKLTNVATGKTSTVQVDGPIGVLIAWLGENRTGFDLKISGKTGNPYTSVMQEQDPN